MERSKYRDFLRARQGLPTLSDRVGPCLPTITVSSLYISRRLQMQTCICLLAEVHSTSIVPCGWQCPFGSARCRLLYGVSHKLGLTSDTVWIWVRVVVVVRGMEESYDSVGETA